MGFVFVHGVVACCTCVVGAVSQHERAQLLAFLFTAVQALYTLVMMNHKLRKGAEGPSLRVGVLSLMQNTLQ